MVWAYPTSPLILSEDTIHIWKVNIGQISSPLGTFYALLNAEERQRADRYRFEDPRRRFILARVLLRYLLGQYTYLPPERIVLVANPWGKPMLAEGMDTSVEFNGSHSNDLALYAFTRHHAVGVDVEFIHPIEHIEHLVTRYFSTAERRAFRRIPEEMQLQAFFNGWTRKEAYIKGKGKGLSIPLNAFDVTLAPDEPAALLADRTDASAAQHWRLLNIGIHPEDGYSAALAAQTGPNPFHLVGYTLSPEMDLKRFDFSSPTN